MREYQPQDDMRHVDWKATARAQRMIVREFAAEDDRRVSIIFDSRFFPNSEEAEITLRLRLEEERKGEKLSSFSQRFEKELAWQLQFSPILMKNRLNAV